MSLCQIRRLIYAKYTEDGSEGKEKSWERWKIVRENYFHPSLLFQDRKASKLDDDGKNYFFARLYLSLRTWNAFSCEYWHLRIFSFPYRFEKLNEGGINNDVHSDLKQLKNVPAGFKFQELLIYLKEKEGEFGAKVGKCSHQVWINILAGAFCLLCLVHTC